MVIWHGWVGFDPYFHGHHDLLCNVLKMARSKSVNFITTLIMKSGFDPFTLGFSMVAPKPSLYYLAHLLLKPGLFSYLILSF